MPNDDSLLNHRWPFTTRTTAINGVLGRQGVRGSDEDGHQNPTALASPHLRWPCLFVSHATQIHPSHSVFRHSLQSLHSLQNTLLGFSHTLHQRSNTQSTSAVECMLAPPLLLQAEGEPTHPKQIISHSSGSMGGEGNATSPTLQPRSTTTAKLHIAEKSRVGWRTPTTNHLITETSEPLAHKNIPCQHRNQHPTTPPLPPVCN